MDKIRKMDEDRFPAVRDFYWELTDAMKDARYRPGWKKGIYPSDDFLRGSLRAGELFALTDNGRIIAAMVLNHRGNDGYAGTAWGIDAADDRVTVIHALGVLPDHQGRGIAGQLVGEAVRLARKSGQKAIRLDVLDGNLPAVRLYEACGFSLRRKTGMFYEDTGRTDFLLYERIL